MRWDYDDKGDYDNDVVDNDDEDEDEEEGEKDGDDDECCINSVLCC